MSPIARFIVAQFCLTAVACSDPGGSTSRPPPAAIASDRIPIEQAEGVVVKDPVRTALAFHEGLVGRPPAEAAPASSLLPPPPPPTCGIPPSPPCPPPPFPTLDVNTMSTTAIRTVYQCGTNTQLIRTWPGEHVALATDCNAGTTIDSGLTPGTNYCYGLVYPDGQLAAPQKCASTLHEPYIFNGPGLTQAESDQMAASFSWANTEYVAATITGGRTALYSMNILIQTKDDLYGLRGLGIHTQTQPLFKDEQDAWDGKVMKAMSAQGEPKGVWIAAIVPGPVYNDIRYQAITGIANGTPIGLGPFVFRKINQPGAAAYPGYAQSPIDPTYIGEQGIEYNGYDKCDYDEDIGAEVCFVEQALVGWLANKYITFVIEVYEHVIDAVQQMIGAIVKLVKGEVEITVHLELRNSDPKFDVNDVPRSGWKGEPLVLKGLKVRVYQGVAEFTGTTDAGGAATVEVAKNLEAKVCVDLENDRVTIIDTWTDRRFCFPQRIAGTSVAVDVTLVTDNKYANLLVSITDAADYLSTVMNHNVSRMTVLTGWQSAILTSLNNGASFAPCMGRMPNFMANLILYAGGALHPTVTVLGEMLEFAAAYDIVMDDGDIASRGVGVHEYGHAAMCDLMRNASQTAASVAWAHVIFSSLTGQDPDMQQSMVAEGFADFLAAQVVGGTNYFAPTLSESSMHMKYCTSSDSLTANGCLELNSKRCSVAPCDKQTNIRYVTSLLHDVFDRIPADLAERADPPVGAANDASHWIFDGVKLLHHHASNQVSSTDRDTIQLEGSMLSSIFEAWADRGSTLSYDTFLGAVAQVLRDEGFDVTAVCNLFAAHEQNNQCPQYVIDVFGGPPPPGNPPPSFDRFAYALADQPANQAEYEPDTTYSHSGAGSTIKVLRTVAGHYTVTFSDLPASGPGMSASVAVTAFGSAPISCSAGDLSTVAGSAVVTVICWDHAQGMAADSRFSIMFVGNTGMPAPSAFLASGGDPLPPLDPERAWTSGWYAQSVTRAAAGSYRVNHGVGNALVSTKMITARGGLGGERCNMADLISAGEEVRCYDRFGTQVDGRFNAVQLAGGKPGRRFATALVYQASLPTSVGHPDASYSSAGGTITITRSSVGKYVVELPGLQKEAGHTENVQVSALSTLPRTCNAVSMANSATGLQVGVECREGVPFVDARFEIAVVE